ncbi:MAG: IgGFc-binding protein, partial [Bacteroidota bacterium]
MKKIFSLVMIMTMILLGSSCNIYAQKIKKDCACSTGDITLTVEEAQILRDNYKPDSYRSNLKQPENWGNNNTPLLMPGNREQVFDSKGTEFWLTMMRNYDTYSPNLYLDITGSESASGVVEIPGISFSQAYTVAANTITRVNLPSGAMLSGEGIANRGIHVTADKEVTVYGMNRIAYTTDAFLGLPLDILATQYLAMTYTGSSGASFAPEFAIVSPYDNNIVQITPSSSTFGGHGAGVTFNVTLNAGQVYQVLGYGDLTGSIVQSSLPVAFFSGNSCTNIPAGVAYCDHIVEQIPPTTTWGSTFVTYPLAGRLHGDTWRFLAAQDNTELYINSVYVTTLNFGDFYETILENSAYVTATKPILTAQFANGNQWDPEIANNGDPFMTIIPPYQQFMSGYTFATPSSGFVYNDANLTVESEGIPFQYLDNILVNPALFNDISTSGFSGSALPLTVGTHTSNNSNSNQFGIYIYGFNADDSYGYPGGLSLEFINQGSGPVITLTPATININSTSQPSGADIEITALITDAEAPFVQSATLYFRKIGDAVYLPVTMINVAGDIWSGTIPGGSVLFPGVQYYIFATDGQVSATSPAVDPVNNPYSIAVDNEPPVIIHTPVTNSLPGIAIPILAEVTDITLSLQSVQLFYRVAGGNPVYSMLIMNKTTGDNYEAMIPGALMTVQGIEYYIKATDNYGVISTSGTADAPHFIAAGTSECLNPAFGGEIGNAQANCGEFDPSLITNISLPVGFNGNLEFKWQLSNDNITFMDIDNSNAETFDPGFLTATTWFKRLARVDCMSDWTGAAESNVIEMTVNAPIDAAITESLLPEFCQGQGVLLTAEASLTPAVSWLWSTGETTESILAGVSGVYTVTVTNASGCTATKTYNLTVDITNLLSSYVIFANKHVRMDGNTVNDGGIGVKNIWAGCVEARYGTMVTDEGTFAKAKLILPDATSLITNKYFTPLTLPWPAFEAMSGNPTIIKNIPANTTMTLDGNLYKEVKVGVNATAIFTQPVLDIKLIRMEDGATLKFAPCTKVHLRDGLISKKNITINPDEFKVIFYIDSDVQFMEGAYVTGVLYLGNSNANSIYKHKLSVNASTLTRPAIFKGMFLAETIYSMK